MDEIKRKLIHDKSCLKKLRRSIDQERSITSIEHFSNELFYEIFDYLDGFELYEAFSNLNIRFQNLLNCTLLRLKISFPFLTELDFQNHYNKVIFPNRHRIISLCIIDILINDSLFSLITIDSSFDRLESLVIFGLKSVNLLSLLISLTTLSHFFSLTLYMIDDIEDLSDAYRIIFSLSVLKYNKISFERDEIDIPLSINSNYQLSPIQYLIIDHSCNFYELITMLSCTPQLRHLSCEFLNQSNRYIEEEIKIKLSYLTHISIDNCRLQFDEFEIFIQKMTSQLKVLRIKTSNDMAYLDANRWERLILQYMPCLCKFHFEYLEYVDHEFELTPYHSFLRQFISQFWINRRWVIELTIDAIDLNSIEVTYSIHPYKQGWYELNELEKYYPNSIQLSQSAVLIIVDIFNIDWNDIFISVISPVFMVLQITHLIIECQDIFIGILIELLRLLPNLDSLKIYLLSLSKPRYLSIDEANHLWTISKNNKITKVNVQQTVELAEVQFLIDLCPRMQYFEIHFSSEINLNLLVRFILMKTSRSLSQLYILCLCMKEVTDEMVDEIKKMINLEKLLNDYTITYVSDKIYIQLK